MNGPENLFRVIDIDIAENGDTQKTHGFLAMHQENDPGAAQFFQAGDQSLPGDVEKFLFQHRLQCDDHQK